MKSVYSQPWLWVLMARLPGVARIHDQRLEHPLRSSHPSDAITYPRVSQAWREDPVVWPSSSRTSSRCTDASLESDKGKSRSSGLGRRAAPRRGLASVSQGLLPIGNICQACRSPRYCDDVWKSLRSHMAACVWDGGMLEGTRHVAHVGVVWVGVSVRRLGFPAAVTAAGRTEGRECRIGVREWWRMARRLARTTLGA